jgi:hypothetical protein
MIKIDKIMFRVTKTWQKVEYGSQRMKENPGYKLKTSTVN